jgi:hypothetical protein
MTPTIDHSSAITYCSTLNLAGHMDWRVPTKIELLSIFDFGKSSPAINPIFTSSASSAYWTSTRFAQDPTLVWAVYFSGGTGPAVVKPTNTNLVRCVR